MTGLDAILCSWQNVLYKSYVISTILGIENADICSKWKLDWTYDSERHVNSALQCIDRLFYKTFVQRKDY